MLSKRLGGIAMFGAMAAVTGAGIAQAQTDPFSYRPYARGNNESVAERARPDYEPAGMPAGAFRLYPEVTLGYQYRDNVFADDAGSESDSVLAAGAKARLVSQWSRNLLALSAAVQRFEFADLSDESTTDWSLGADGRLDILRAIQVVGGLSYVEATEARGSNDPAGIASPIEYDTFGQYVGVTREFGRVRASARLDHAELDYQDAPLSGGGVADQDFRDRDNLDLTGRLDVALTPDTALFLTAAQRWRDYDVETLGPGGNRDFDTTRVLAGAGFDLTNLIRGEVGVGYVWTSFDDAAFEEVDGFSLRGLLEWFPTQLTTIAAEASRDVDDAGIVGASASTQDRARLSLDHELRRNILLSASVSYLRDSFEEIDREDENWYYRVGGDWFLTRSVAVNASFERREQDSTGVLAGRDFDANTVSVGVRLRR